MHPSDIPFPNILRSGFFGCGAKFELTRKWSSRGILGCEIGVFGEEMGTGVTCYFTEERRRTQSMTKKGHQKFFDD